MALFRKSTPQEPAPESPALLFRDLHRDPSIKFLWSHQEKILDLYHENAFGQRDVAVELPTGSGKTLVGLLIGEFRRRIKHERVVFLCPNRQLCAQVASQSAKYGIPHSLLTGKQKDYDQSAFLKYQQAQSVAITTYSGIFNTNPAINDPECVICDDAHAADGFVASLWTLRVTRQEKALYDDLYNALHNAIPETLRHHIESTEDDPYQRNNVDLISPVLFHEHVESIGDTIRRHLPSFPKLRYPWEMINGHVTSCVIYSTPQAFEIRPIIPPTMTHSPFANAKQRVYMSATLGENGDIERSFGVQALHRIPIPAGWDKRGTGRRLILFPGMAVDATVGQTLNELLSPIERCLVLAPNDHAKEAVKTQLPNGFSVLGPEDIESDLSSFIQKDKAILLLANRYDGIDLPGDACRFMALVSLPTGCDLQERFLTERLGAYSQLQDRIRTRVTQAIGRCTRDEGDFSIVLALGGDLLKWLCTKANVDGMHPELQAEIRFGLENSTERTLAEFKGLCEAFLFQNEDWKDAEQDIHKRRNESQRITDETAGPLRSAARFEIGYSRSLWTGDYDAAFQDAVKATESLTGGDALKPYRSFWYHNAAVAAFLAHRSTGNDAFRTSAIEYLKRAHATTHLRWLSTAIGMLGEKGVSDTDQVPWQEWYVQLKTLLERIGIVGKKYQAVFDRGRQLIASTRSKEFEQGLELLGTLLGAESHRLVEDGSPDGLWVFGDWWSVVFEAKTDEKPEGGISLDTVRQAATHAETARSRKIISKTLPCQTVVVSPRQAIDKLAQPHCREMCYLKHNELVALYDAARAAFCRVRAMASGANEEEIKSEFIEQYRQAQLLPTDIRERCERLRLSGLRLG